MPVFKKGSKLYSIVYLKCPRCQQGDLFSEKNAWKIPTMLKMPPRCPVCKQDYVFETGFYSAALWTSYPIVILLAGIIILIVFGWLHISGFWLLLITGALLISLQPYIMRLGRSILINNFVDYDNRYPEDGDINL